MSLRLVFLATLALLLLSLPLQAQEESLTNLIDIEVDTAFNNYFRPNYWLPLRVHLSNQGDDVNGRIVVRPETSGRVVTNAYSTPIELPNGSEKTAFLYLQARAFPNSLVVEVLDNSGVRLAQATVGTLALNPHDRLHIVVSDSSANSLSLADLKSAGYQSAQARWTVEQIPPEAAALEAVDTFIFYDVDSEQLTVGQRAALEAWVAMGGHLVVIGGPNWQESAAAFEALLPFTPQDSQSLDNLSALAAYIGDDSPLATRSLMTLGTVKDNAQVLIADSENRALLIRRDYGVGVVDYLSVDPTLEPLRTWQALPEFWYTIMTNVGAETGWGRGFVETQEAARAIAILPGVELLPPVLSMIAFIGAYILLIGPVNYWVLSRFNRPAWAWFTIPLLIGAFTFVAWTFGFNLRGSEIIVSRLNVVHTYPESETARIDQLIGILSPRRETYTMSFPEGRFLRVMPSLSQNSLLQANFDTSSANIVQTSSFTAQEIAIDGGIFANFSTLGTSPKPNISGTATISYRTGEETGQDFLASVRNNSELTLEDAIVVTRNRYYRLPEALAPGDLVTFDASDMTILHNSKDDIVALPSAFETVYDLELGESRNVITISASLVSSRLLMGQDASIIRRTVRTNATTQPLTEEQVRRFALARAVLRDQYATQGLGDDVFLIGWTNQLEADLVIEGVSFRPVETGMYIIQLAVTVEEPPANETVILSSDQFTWSIRGRESAEGFVHDVLVINPGYVDVRMTPLPSAILKQVDYLEIELDRSSSYGREVQVHLWNWELDEWEMLPVTAREVYELTDVARFIGPNNIVDLRLQLDDSLPTSSAAARIRGLKIKQGGTF